MSDAIVSIHTSDKNTFKTCRQQWDFSSELRRGWRPKKAAMALDFGTAMHASWEVYYDPKTWHLVRGDIATRDTRQTICDLAVARFDSEMRRQKLESLTTRKMEALDPVEQIEYDTHMDLGHGMLRHYFEWCPLRDTFTPVAVEIKFSIPILVPATGEQMVHPVTGELVFYEGRIDEVLMDDNGLYWVWDDKTAARYVDIEYLELDEQCLAYIWAGIQSGFPIVGMIYNEVYKGYPQPPQENKTRRQGRSFSVNKQQDTSYEAYVNALIAADEDLELYEDFLVYLKENPKEYFRRTWIQKSQAQLNRFESRIFMEVSEMIDPNLNIYPSPNRMKCKYCAYRGPCISKEEEGDFEFILEANYRNLHIPIMASLPTDERVTF